MGRNTAQRDALIWNRIEPMTETTYDILARQLIEHLPDKKAREGWPAFTTDRPEHEALKMAAQDWVKTYEPRKSLGLRLCGQTGCGKTLLAQLILVGLIQRGYPRVQIVNSVDHFYRIKHSYDSHDETERGLWEEILDNDVLVFDDLGAEVRPKAPQDYIIDGLYNFFTRAGSGKPTLIVTSNFGMTDLAELYGPGRGARFISRLDELTEPLGEWPRVDMRREG